jgi:hypothetical protein
VNIVSIGWVHSSLKNQGEAGCQDHPQSRSSADTLSLHLRCLKQQQQHTLLCLHVHITNMASCAVGTEGVHDIQWTSNARTSRTARQLLLHMLRCTLAAPATETDLNIQWTECFTACPARYLHHDMTPRLSRWALLQLMLPPLPLLLLLLFQRCLLALLVLLLLLLLLLLCTAAICTTATTGAHPALAAAAPGVPVLHTITRCDSRLPAY